MDGMGQQFLISTPSTDSHKPFAKKVRVVDMLQSKATICPCKMVPWIDMKQYGKVYCV